MYPAVRRSRVPRSVAIQAPTGGLDTSESWAAMESDKAIKLQNWFPDTDRVTLRAGSKTRITGLGARVETIMTYAKNNGEQMLFAVAGGTIYNVTPPLDTASSMVTGLTNSRWQWTNYGTLGGQFLIAVNGQDESRIYDGTNWAATAITGVDETALTWVTAHQRRLWFGLRDKLDVYYLDTDAVAGAATPFYLGPVARAGGYVMAMGTWTRDSGAGPDDVAVFVTSEGELLIYQGTDPSSVSTWGLVGVYEIGKPIGPNCMVKFGGDLLIVTELGVLPMSKATITDIAQQNTISISKRINKTFNDYVSLHRTLYGWQPIVFAPGRMLIINAPVSNSKSEQFVFNTLTGAACQFTGLHALCWGAWENRIFFGTPDGRIVEAFVGVLDDNVPVDGDAIQAFNYFSSAGVEKAFKRVSPIFVSSADPTASIQVYTNFNLARFTAQPQQPISTDSLWGVAKWGIDKWGSSGRVWANWIPIEGVGRSATVRIRVRVQKGRPSWMATNWTFVGGGNL